MPDLTARLMVAIGETEDRARRMKDAVWPTEIHVVTKDDTGYLPDEAHGCVSVAPGYRKAYRRMWEENSETDYGWRYHDSAMEVWSEEVADAALRRCAAEREIVALYQALIDEIGGSPWRMQPDDFRAARTQADILEPVVVLLARGYGITTEEKQHG